MASFSSVSSPLLLLFSYYSSSDSFFPGLRAVRERLDRRRRKMCRVFPSNSTGKRSRLCTTGWERDGKAGRQKVDGMGWELIISRWDGNGRETSRETRRETRRHVGRHRRNRFVAFITTNCCFLAVGSCTLYV